MNGIDCREDHIPDNDIRLTQHYPRPQRQEETADGETRAQEQHSEEAVCGQVGHQEEDICRLKQHMIGSFPHQTHGQRSHRCKRVEDQRLIHVFICLPLKSHTIQSIGSTEESIKYK